MSRPIYEIAREISKDWQPANYAAVPYLVAMKDLNTMDEHYGLDSAYSVIAYFLANARTWRGETARRVKKELNGMLGL